MKRIIFSLLVLGATLTMSAVEPPIPLLDTAPYDTVINEKKVALYTISNGTVAAQISNYGGFIVSLFAPDKSGNYVNLVTGYPNIHQYMRYNLGMVGPALGRFANRIGNATFTLDGKEYTVTRNSGQHILHGGLQGFDHTVWDVVSSTETELVMTCMLADGLDGFPGNLTTKLTYSITKDNGLSIAYEATTDKVTIVNLSNHAYFNLNGAGNGDILGHELMVAADNITETDRMGIPSGTLTPVAGTPYDFRKPVKLSDRQVATQGFGFGFGQRAEIPEGKVRVFDNNFCLNHKSEKKIEKIAELYSPESGRVMEVWNDQPGLQVYSGARTAIALESQNYPDSPNHPNFPSSRLDPGETYRHTCIYKFTTR